MNALHRKLALGLAVGVGSIGIFSAAALGAFGPEVSTNVGSTIAPIGSAVLGEDKPDKLKAILDGLVQKGVITQPQEDAILASLKDAAGKHEKHGKKGEAVLREFLATSAQYLGIPEKDLRAKLPGTSLAAIANATAGKNRDGLVAALNLEARADVDKALANKRITEDQAKKLRDELPGRITTLVDRTWPAKPTAAVRGPHLKSFLGDLLHAGRDYLGLSPEALMTQLRAGKSVGEVADATPGKSRVGLIAALTTAANTRIDQAVTNKSLSVDQATTLKTKVGAEITTFVDRKLTLRNTTKPGAPAGGTTTPTKPASPAPREEKD